MSATTVRLLKAAAEIVGGDRALANRLGIDKALLSRFMADSRDLPDPLVLRTVDIILADRQHRLTQIGQPAAPTFDSPDATMLASGAKRP
jgi:hypothetical protein